MENHLKNIQKQISYKVFVENHPAIILVIDIENGAIIDANIAAEKFYGYSKEEFISKNITDINIYSKEYIYLEMQMARKQKRNFFKFIHKLKDGSTKKVNVISYPIVYNEKEYLFSVVMEYSDEDNKSDIDILELLNTSEDAICMINSEDIYAGEIVYANSSFTKVMDRELESIKTLTVRDLFMDIDENHGIGKKYIGGTHSLTLKNEENLSVQVNSIKIKNKGEVFSLLHIKPINYKVVSAIDLTDRFIKDVDREFQGSNGYIIGLEIYSNSSEMEYINKFYEYIQRHLVSELRLNLVKFHVGIEPFKTLLFTPSSLFEITSVLNEFLSRVEEDEKYQFYSKFCKFRVGVSQSGNVVEEQVKCLKKTLDSFGDYQYNSVIYSTRNDDFFRSIKLKKDLSKAISNNEFVLHAQAVVNIDTKVVEGVEILVRWQHEEYGLVYPKDFIKYAEISGSIKEIDLWVLSESLKFVEQNKSKVENLKFHVNLSSRSFEHQEVYELLSSYSTELLSNIVLDITEQSNYEILNESFDIIRSTGVSFAIDDFGTGYSSFERILKSGVKYIKIDRSLIKNIVKNTDDLIILQTILAMCKSLQIEVIAKGVEDVDQLEFLDARNCNLIQGFLFDRPLELATLFERMNSINQNAVKCIPSDSEKELLKNTFYNTGRIFVQNLDENFKFKNPNIQFAEKLGLDMNEVLELKFLDLLKESERVYFLDAVKRGNDLGESISVATQLQSKGKSFDVICAGEIGKDSYIRMYIEFLENQKQDELMLRGLSKSYVEAFYKAPVGMIVVSDNFTIRRWNKTATKIFGYNVSEVLGENLSKLITKEGTSEGFNKVFNNALVGGSHEAILDNIDCYDNDLKCQWNVNLISEDKSSRKTYICIIQNITEKIELEKERVKINNALNQSKSAIIMTDLEGNFTYVNAAFIETTGYSKDEIINRSTNILASKEQGYESYKELWTTINKGEVWSGEFRNKKKDGTLYWAKTSIYPIIEDENIQGFIAIQLDVTSEKDLININENLKLKLYEQDKIASLGLITTGIMHEINNPLSYIQGNIEYLIGEIENMSEKDVIIREDFRETLVDVSLGIKQIKDIAYGLKKYIFKDKSEIPDVIDIVEVINEILTISKNEYKYYANIKFEYDKKDHYLALGFAPKLKQVIMNLIINASHAIESKKMKTLGVINIQLENSDDYVEIRFNDNGIGMDNETLINIFEAFFTTKESGVGSGLGLSITKDIIENDHKGYIDCESEIGIGTTFTIKIPKATK